MLEGHHGNADVGARARAAAWGILTIDLGALIANYRLIAARVAPARTAAVVKADGYGLGAAAVAGALAAAGCRDFFVALLDEALDLEPLLPPDARLYVLNGLPAGSEALCAGAGIVPILNSLDQARRWRATAAALGRPLPAPIQVDSGMSRLGLPADAVVVLAGEAGFFDDVPLTFVMSHLACADETGTLANEDQRRRFDTLAKLLPPAPRSFANSGGCFLDDAFHGDLVRPGISLYGGAPLPGANPMAAVVALAARVVQLRDVPAGQGVGYGLTFVAPTPRRLATIGVGYADGWLRSLSNRGAAWFGGVRLPIAGRVSMDSIILDVTDLPEGALHEGDLVELIGPHQSIDAVAADAGTIAYEVLTSLGRRYARHYVGGPAFPSQAEANA